MVMGRYEGGENTRSTILCQLSESLANLTQEIDYVYYRKILTSRYFGEIHGK
jgi:hypothetical protein